MRVALSVLALGTALGAAPQGRPPQLAYDPELEMVVADARGRLRPAQVDAATGRAVAPGKAGVPAFVAARTVEAGAELHQNHLRDVSILRPEALNPEIRDDLGFAAGLDRSRKALVLSRLNHLQRREGWFEVSNIIGLVQNKEVYLGQLEMRSSRDGRLMHVVRTLQRGGPLLGNGFPSLAISEMVQTATETRQDLARTARIMLVFPRTQNTEARIQVHKVGRLQRLDGGRMQTRDVHVISEFRPGGDGVTARVWTSAGERYAFMSWEEALQVKHEADWRTVGSGLAGGSHKWERPFHPYAPAARGVRPVPVVTLLQLPGGWQRGGYSGGPLQGKKVSVKGDRWTLTDKDFLVHGGLWCFDKKGELVLRTPYGTMNARKVTAFFTAAFRAARDDAAQSAALRDCLTVILNWAADMPQLSGSGPGDKPPSVVQLLEER